LLCERIHHAMLDDVPEHSISSTQAK
jgi:hypothetical protein